MTRTKVKALVALAVLVLVVAVGYEYQRLTANLDSYDQRYSDCMNYKLSWLPPPQRYFTDANYQREAADCEDKATAGGPLW